MTEGGTHTTLPSLTSDMGLPPYARRLDVRATRAAFAAGTLSTVGDHVTGENVQRDVELRHADRHNADVMDDGYADIRHAAYLVARAAVPQGSNLVLDPDVYRREFNRLAFLRRAQYVDPRERRA